MKLFKISKTNAFPAELFNQSPTDFVKYLKV